MYRYNFTLGVPDCPKVLFSDSGLAGPYIAVHIQDVAESVAPCRGSGRIEALLEQHVTRRSTTAVFPYLSLLSLLRQLH